MSSRWRRALPATVLLTLVALILLSMLPALGADYIEPECPYLYPVPTLPYATLHYQFANTSITDAIVTQGYLLVATATGSIQLYPIRNITYSVDVGSVTTPQLITFTMPDLVDIKFDYIAPGIVGLRARPAGATAGYKYVSGVLKLCEKPKLCLVLTHYTASSSTLIGVYGLPKGAYKGDFVAFYKNGLIYILDKRPNVLDNIIDLNGTIVGVYRLTRCNSDLVGFLLMLGNSTFIVLNPSMRIVTSFKLNLTRLYSVWFDPFTSLTYIVGWANESVVIATILAASKPLISIERIRVPAEPKLATVIGTSEGPLLLLYYSSPSHLEAWLLGSRSPRVLWSIPIDGELLQFYPLREFCLTNKMLLVVGFYGSVRLQLLNVNNGVLEWVPLAGLPLDNATILHFSEKWLIAGNGHDLYLVYIPLLLKRLYAVPFGLLIRGYVGTPLSYEAIISCLYGECIGLPEIRVVGAKGIVWLALPPGVYRVVYVSVYGVYERYFMIPSECKLASFNSIDPSTPPLQSSPPSIAYVRLVNVTICVWSAGDPQGWGFGRGPLPGANVTIERVDAGLVVASSNTGINGCLTLPLAPGEYRVYASAPGFHSKTTSIIVTPNTTSFSIYLEPLTIPVVFNVIAADTNQKLNASITLSCCGKTALVHSGTRVLLPPGFYEALVKASMYNPERLTLNITLETIREHGRRPLIISTRLTPRLFNVAFRLLLAFPLRKNVTVVVTYQRLYPIRSPPITKQYEAKVSGREAIITDRLVWGKYRVTIKVPYHLPAEINITIPSPKVYEVRLQIVKYRVVIKAVDSMTGKEVATGTAILRGVGGFSLKVPLGTPVLVPLGNYTYIIQAPHYQRLTGKLIVTRDVELRVALHPLKVPVDIAVYLGDKPLPNVTVNIVGVAFNGIHVSTSKNVSRFGRASVRLMPGRYTFSTGYVASTLFLRVALNTSKTVDIDDKPVAVELRIPPSIILVLVGILPFLLFALIALIVTILIIVLRKRFTEGIKRLRESLVERLGARGYGGEEEEEEELF